MQLAAKLQSLKTESNLTNKEIAEKSGVPESTVRRIISGETAEPSVFSLAKIVSATNGSLDLLFGLEHEINYRDELVEQCRGEIKHERSLNRSLITICTVVLAFLLVVIAVDLLVPTAGWVQY